MNAETQDLVRELDPFGFLIGQGSAIRPLGGAERSPDPRYVFHTPYVEFAPGRVLFTIRFDQLRASFGELRININAYIPGSGRDAIFVTSARVFLSDSIAVERGVSIPIMTVAGATYAAYGYCIEGTDAQATGLTVRAEQVGTADGWANQPLFRTRLDAADLLNPARLIDDAIPRFCDPVSQAMTAEQLAEPEFLQWRGRLAPPPADAASAWRLAFIAQALQRYGMLQKGARGILLGEQCRALAPIFAAAQCDVTLATPAPGAITSGDLWNSAACTPLGAAAIPDDAFAGAPLSLADQPADERGFDFLCALDAVGEGHASGNSIDILIEVMAVLRPGGFAILLLDLAVSPSEAANILPRAEVERLAVRLISRKFTVAQLNFTTGSESLDSVPFGLIVRKD